MEDRANREELLETLRRLAGMEYLSDLRQDYAREKLTAVLSGLRAEDYPLEQWSTALAYIWDAPLSFGSLEEVAAWLRLAGNDGKEQ